MFSGYMRLTKSHAESARSQNPMDTMEFHMVDLMGNVQFHRVNPSELIFSQWTDAQPEKPYGTAMRHRLGQYRVARGVTLELRTGTTYSQDFLSL